jgi:exonuclease SbcD
MRLSQAGIHTLLLVGNHDLSPAMNRAHAMTEFSTLQVPHVQVLDRPCFLTPDDLGGLPTQVLAIPWISRSGMMAHLDIHGRDLSQIYEELEERLTELVGHWLDEADPDLPIVLTAHASVQGAKYGGERTVMLGGDLVLPGSLVRDKRLDYVALGHIHKHQNLNEDSHPPVVYPGSIERVDFGEAGDEKFFVIAEVEKGASKVAWRELTDIRSFVDRFIRLEDQEAISDQLRAALPPQDQLTDAIVRLVLEYPREWEAMIDEAALREYTAEAFEFHLIKRPQQENRIRLAEDQTMGSLSPYDLLDIYWKAHHVDQDSTKELLSLAENIIRGDDVD